MPAQVTADDMAIASDAILAAEAGSVPNTLGDRWRILVAPSMDRIKAAYQNLLEEWDRDNGTWTENGVIFWNRYLGLAHSLAGDLWDSNFTLGVRVLDANQKMANGGVKPSGIIQEAKEYAQKQADNLDKALRPLLPQLAGIGKTLVIVAVGLGIVLILYAIGPALQAGATVYRTNKKAD